MYRLIIADDEKRIRMGLKNIIDWEKLGFEVTEIFSDGQEVMEYLEYVMPDVILTDIKMNHVSGIEIVKYIFEHQLPCKVILLSGHQEFELAVQAIRYGAEDYLLKPTDVEKLEETFLKLKEKLDKTKEKLRQNKADKERAEEAIPILEERFFGDLVLGVIESDEYIRNCMNILYPGADLKKMKCFVADIYIEDYKHFIEEIWKYSYDQLEINLENFFRIYKEGYSFHIVYKSEEIVEIMGIQTENLMDSITSGKAMEKLLENIEQYFKFHASFQVRQEYENVFQIRQQREQFLKNETGTLVWNQYIQEQKKVLMSNITVGNIITAQKLCINMLRELKSVSIVKRNNLVIDILSTMKEVIFEVNEKLAKSLQPYFNYTAILSITKEEEMETYINRIFDRMRLADEKNEYYDTGSLISKAKAYIKDNIYKDISQEETANYLYICPSYLSRMFKKQTGESFLQYVTKEKMEKAIELLRDPQYKIYQVGEILGYKTPRYFSRIFRNYTGMKPSEYRGKVLHIGGEFDEE